MKKFLIKVNGNQYEVEVEEIRDGSLPVYVPAAPAVSAPAAAPVQAAAPAPAAPVNEKRQSQVVLSEQSRSMLPCREPYSR